MNVGLYLVYQFHSFRYHVRATLCVDVVRNSSYTYRETPPPVTWASCTAVNTSSQEDVNCR